MESNSDIKIYAKDPSGSIIFYSPLITPKNKKYSVISKTGDWVIHFGDRWYQQYHDKLGKYWMLNHGSKQRRNLYLKRASAIRDKIGNLTKDNPTSPNYYSIRYLW